MTTRMKAEDLDKVQWTVDHEGFDYAFVYYSGFMDIEDEKFHELRKTFLEARKKLAQYIKTDA